MDNLGRTFLTDSQLLGGVTPPTPPLMCAPASTPTKQLAATHPAYAQHNTVKMEINYPSKTKEKTLTLGKALIHGPDK